MHKAVIMAGGRGTRLSPLTDSTPKPMLPVKGKPIIDHIIDGLGDREIIVTVNYLASVIVDYLGDSVSHIWEERPLGTAGSLSLMDRPSGSFIVMNGDILTNVDYDDVMEYHHDGCYHMTMCVQPSAIRIKYGVVTHRDGRVIRVDEKPKHRFHINAGIYVLEPDVLEYVYGRFDMTDLIDACLSDNLRVGAYVMPEDVKWVDIGSPYDYEQVNK